MSSPLCPLLAIAGYSRGVTSGCRCLERKCAWWVESSSIKASDGSPCGDCALKLVACSLDSMILDGLPINQ